MAYARVLVPTDLSGASLRAAELARAIAAPDAEFRFLHVLPHPVDAGGLPAAERDLLERYVEERAEAIRLEVGGFARKGGFASPAVKLARGSVPREIATEAAAFDANLVAMGATGASRMARLLMGSTSRAALHRLTDTDVLVAREGPPKPQRILVATDFASPARAAGERALDIARTSGAKLVAFHAFEPGPLGGALKAGTAVGAGHAALLEEARASLARFNVETLEGEAIEILHEGRPAQTLAVSQR